MIILTALTTKCSAQENNDCLAPGKSCYKVNLPCCPGYKCASGPLSTKPQPTDRCISDKIIG